MPTDAVIAFSSSYWTCHDISSFRRPPKLTSQRLWPRMCEIAMKQPAVTMCSPA